MVSAAQASEEEVDAVNEHNEVIGRVKRRDMRRLKLLHRSTFIFLRNSRGQLYVQLRTPTKDYCPSHYDVASGGVLQAGETYEENAARELEEELGLSPRECELTRIATFLFRHPLVQTWGAIFFGAYEGDVNTLKLQPEEVVSVQLWSYETIQQKAKEGVPFTPDSLHALEILQAHLLRQCEPNRQISRPLSSPPLSAAPRLARDSHGSSPISKL